MASEQIANYTVGVLGFSRSRATFELRIDERVVLRPDIVADIVSEVGFAIAKVMNASVRVGGDSFGYTISPGDD